MEKSDFKDKVVIITGSSSGIGKATAISLCKRGAKVVLNGRNPEKLLECRIELTARGFNVIAVKADITNPEDCQNLMQTTLDSFGKIDVLINNASLTMNEQFDQLHSSLFEKIFNSNSMGAVHPTWAALPHLKKTKGSVIFISSLAGIHGLPSASAYCGGKMALTAIWQSLRIELGGSGVHFGICYVSFTQNDTQKRMIARDGELVKVPKRPKFLQQSQQKVANSIIGMIKRRRSKKILSPIGKISAFAFRFLPRTVSFLMIQIQKRNNRKQQLTQTTEAC
ncbi:MAG: SDR family oxidoreductase [Flavobacteriales bacterium]|nr:SDR family oxidoreductase [Flavobacteriales bacterium]